MTSMWFDTSGSGGMDNLCHFKSHRVTGLRMSLARYGTKFVSLDVGLSGFW